MVVQDSNAAVFVNGHAVRLKVTRFNESDVRAEVVSSARLAPLLNPPGHLNSIVVQLFSWGPITQFQRTGAVRVCVCVCVCVCVAVRLVDERVTAVVPRFRRPTLVCGCPPVSGCRRRLPRQRIGHAHWRRSTSSTTNRL